MLNARRAGLALALFFTALLALSVEPASAQTYRDTNGTIVPAVVPLNCPIGGGACTGPGTTGASTAAPGSYAAGFSPDVGNCATATAWTGTGTPSLCSVDLGNYNELQQPLTVQNIPQVRIGAVEQYAPASQPWTTNPTPSSSTSVALSHGVVTSLGNSLVAKASAGNLYGFYCNAITGGAAGYCVAVNAASAPSTGTITGVLDVCYFAAGAGGCSLDRPTFPAAYSTGIVVLVTSAASPFTYTTGVDTAFISADFQ